MRRVMSLWLPSWPIQRRQRSAPSDSPAVTVEWVGGRGLITALDPRLGAALFPGMPLADARAIEPDLAVLPADPAGDRAGLERLARWCGRYSPWTAPDPPDGIWLDLTGAAHLRGGEEELAHELVARLERQGLSVRAAVAETLGAAWALARADGARRVTVVPPGAARVALALLPARLLRLPVEITQQMERLGLRRIGDLCKLPRSSMVARFGLAAAERLDQLLGQLPEPMSPLPPAPIRMSRRRFAEPIVRPEDLAAAIASLAEALCRLLARDGVGARRLALRFFRVDGAVLVLEAGTAQPSRDPRHLARLFAERLERIDPDLGIEDMRLEAVLAEPLASRQEGLGGVAPSLETRDAALAALVDRLENRLGAGAVTIDRPRESHIPERAAEPMPVFAPAKGAAWPLDLPRPVRLLARPEPIEAMAPIPDDPPVLFRWRRLVHRVRLADGPERILGEWWRGEENHYAGEKDWRGGFSPAEKEENLRDYYRVEDMDGRRFWLFRSGLYQPDTDAAPPRWFLHGVFA